LRSAIACEMKVGDKEEEEKEEQKAIRKSRENKTCGTIIYYAVLSRPTHLPAPNDMRHTKNMQLIVQRFHKPRLVWMSQKG
jgi:hypothetical protein